MIPSIAWFLPVLALACVPLGLAAVRLWRTRTLQAGRNSGRSLLLQETLFLDPRRRLHLLTCDGKKLVHPADGRNAGRGSRVAARIMKRWIFVAVGLALLLPLPALAQSVSIDLGAAGQAGATSRIVQLVALVTVLSLAPSLLVMTTAFTRIVIVLSLLRSAISAQGAPPNVVLIGLALFLSFFVMEPVLDQAWTNGIQPMMQGDLSEMDGLTKAAEPFHAFMVGTARPTDVQFFSDLGHVTAVKDAAETPWRVLIPAFMVSELRRAFEIGFLLYLPFLVIDIVVASVLMSLGMMMLPPSAVSLPIKLLFFVMIDGWRLIAGSLVQGFGSG